MSVLIQNTVLPPLNVTKICSSVQYRNKSFFRSKEERKKAREQIYQEMAEGYVADIREFARTKGKRYQAPLYLNSAKEAITFPNMKCRSLTNQNVILPDCFYGNVTLLLMSMRGMGMKMCDIYRNEFAEAFQYNKKVLMFEIQVVEQLLLKLVRVLLEANLKKQIHVDQHDKFLMFYGKFYNIKKTLLIHNSIIGYAFLVDKNGRIRWSSHGIPDSGELNSMIKCTHELLLAK